MMDQMKDNPIHKGKR